MQKGRNINEALIVHCQSRESWLGSFYELSMAYKSAPFDDRTLLHLMQWLWRDRSLLGVVENIDQFGQAWQPIVPSFIKPVSHSYGYIHFPSGQTVGCGCMYTASEDILWLTLYIPLDMLGQIFPVTYPVECATNSWIPQVDHFLATIGDRVHCEYPFWLAVIGEEATAFPLKTILADVANNPGLLLPEATFQQLGVDPYGICFPKGLWWTGGKEQNLLKSSG